MSQHTGPDDGVPLYFPGFQHLSNEVTNLAKFSDLNGGASVQSRN